MTLNELIDYNVAFDDGETRTIMSFDELIEMIGFVDFIPVLETLMRHHDYVTDKFTYSLTDDPITPVDISYQEEVDHLSRILDAKLNQRKGANT